MLLRIILLLLAFNFLFLNCSKKNQVVYETTQKKNPYLIYKEAYKLSIKDDFFYAAKNFQTQN